MGKAGRLLAPHTGRQRREVGEWEPSTHNASVNGIQNTNMSTKCPQPLVIDGEIINWMDVERWMIYNEPMWNSAIHYAGSGGCSHEDAIKLLAFHATEELRAMKANEINRLQNAVGPTSYIP